MGEKLDIETIPLLFSGKIIKDDIPKMLNTDSVLGNVKIEGVVIKNYLQQLLIGNINIPILCAKYVSESFKERNNKEWKAHTGTNRFELYKESFRTEARWIKSVQHLKERGELEDQPSDIGKIIKEVNLDITEECKEDIKDWLWNEYHKGILKTATKGLPEWYKTKLLDNMD